MATAATNGKGSGARSKTGPTKEPDAGGPKVPPDAAGPKVPPDAAAPEPDAGTDSHVCNVAFCPIGLAISAVQPLRPDAVEHLLVAGRELFLAMRTIVDARAEQFEGDRTGATFEKIDIGQAGAG